VQQPSGKGMLGSYRILDLCDETGLMCGKLLGDLGADVIRIEHPDGDSARKIGPFHKDSEHPEKSLFWFAHNTGKRGITLDIDKPEGRDIFTKLLAESDALIESFPPGHLDEVGLGFTDLSRIKPDIVLTSIMPFGPSGPYRDYKATDLTLWALSGLLFICGDPDRPPMRVSTAQSYLHAGTDAATGTVMALFHRGQTGRGQHVQVSALKALERAAYTAHTLWDARGKILRRAGSSLRIPPLGTMTPVIWQCDDGYVAFYLFGGAMGVVSNPALTQWMDEEGLATEYMKTMDWRKFNIGTTPQDQMDKQVVSPITQFFRRHTQKELWEEGVKRRVMVYAVNDAAGVMADEQLKERDFWVVMEHADLGETLTYPGPFMKTDNDLCRVGGPAPTIGQHNHEIYSQELGIRQDEIDSLKTKRVI
jgi:benzylsuccinate CoA-transferase BbsE subunit